MSAPPTPDQPLSFGRYELLELVGEGAMAQVFRARQSGPMGFRKEVAIKRLRSGTLRSDRRELESLVNEARLGGQLRHPHLVEVYGCDVVDGSFFVAMEFVRGWTLDQVLWAFVERGEELPVVAVVDILRQLARGLGYVHAARGDDGQPLHLIHRDLKPQNIFLDRQGVVKIADFGLAKSTANLYQTTDADVTKGSPLYMSPEQIEGATLDGRSDLFALGSLAVELVTGVPAFEGSSVANTLRKVLDADCKEAWEPFVATAPALAPIVGRLLALDRGARYPDGDALARDLDLLLPGEPAGVQTRALAGLLAGEPPPGLPPGIWPGWERLGRGMGLLPAHGAEAAPTEPAPPPPEDPGGEPPSAIGLVLLCGLLLLGILGLSWRLLAPHSTVELPPPPRATAAPPPRAESEALLHVPPSAAQAFGDLLLEVEALDGGPHAPRLRYRKGGGGTWRAVPMQPVGPARYAATVPVSQDAGTELDYYIEDGDQGLGSSSSPFRVPVR